MKIVEIENIEKEKKNMENWFDCQTKTQKEDFNRPKRSVGIIPSSEE